MAAYLVVGACMALYGNALIVKDHITL